MPTTLAAAALPEETRQRALLPLVDAVINGHLGTAVSDFAKTVFGTTAFDEALAARKDEMKGMEVNGFHGGQYVCTSLMRSYVVLKGLGEEENAEELLVIAV
ncbi:hypothetical protein LTR08_005635 [Meristemomyces frigidus]|nr:hypothetical protein LTR08_005635 [Meristemomyces frigidus]